MRRRSIGIVGLVAVVVALSLVACGQLEHLGPGEVEQQVVVTPDPEPDPEPSVTVQKEFSVQRATFFEPRVTSKVAVEVEVDITAGSADLEYQIVVENVLIDESNTVAIEALVVENTGPAAITVDIVDTLYCGDGFGAIDLDGPLAIEVLAQNGVLIAAGAAFTAGPFGPIDVTACPIAMPDAVVRDVVNRIVVFEAGTDTVIGHADLLPTPLAISGIVFKDFLVDAETMLPGHTFTNPSLKLGDDDVPFTVSTDGGLYTIKTESVAGTGTYALRKTIVRDAGLVCDPELMVHNSAYLVDAEGSIVGTPSEATILLLCTPPMGGEGCTPGFWKNWTGAPPGQQPNAWLATGYDWVDPFTSAGFVDAYRSRTFLEVLSQGGGGRNALGRHTVAALLNAAHPHVAYDLTVHEVVAMFNQVILEGGNVNALRALFESYNEQGCPLNAAVY